MIILRQREYSWFNSYDLFDFFEDVENCNYPNKNKKLLKYYTMDWDSTYEVFSKGKVNKKEITRKLNSLDSLVSDILKRYNIPGTTRDWQLYVVYLVGPDKIGLGLENKKNPGPNKAFSCEI